MHVKVKKLAFAGILLAFAQILIFLASVIESSTLFFLAGAAFLCGIIVNELDLKSGFTFFVASILLGFVLSPNKMYMFTFMAFCAYILMIETVRIHFSNTYCNKKIFYVIKYIFFNVIFISAVIIYFHLFMGETVSTWMMLLIFLIGQVGLYLYDISYRFVIDFFYARIKPYLK